jgi:hypothetical protein
MRLAWAKAQDPVKHKLKQKGLGSMAQETEQGFDPQHRKKNQQKI